MKIQEKKNNLRVTYSYAFHTLNLPLIYYRNTIFFEEHSEVNVLTVQVLLIFPSMFETVRQAQSYMSLVALH